MANNLLKTVKLIQRSPQFRAIAVRYAHGGHSAIEDYDTPIIGNREVVGYGNNGMALYIDQLDCPMPAVRFLPPDAPGIKALREKEKGDWKKLTKEEKKTLYRASFCQTFSELHAPDSFWKAIVAALFVNAAIGLWIVMFLKTYVLDPLPVSLSLENRQAQLQRFLDLEVDHVDGLSSRYDYEKGTWKK